MDKIRRTIICGTVMAMAMPWQGWAQSTIRCEQNGRYTNCTQEPARQGLGDFQFFDLNKVLPPVQMPQIVDPTRGVAARAMEEERLNAMRRENALREQEIELQRQRQERAAQTDTEIQNLGQAISNIETYCQTQFDTGRIKTHYEKLNCTSDKVLPLLAQSSLPLDDIMKAAYAKAKMVAKRADSKEISLEQMELEEATIEGETAQLLRQRLAQWQ